MHRSYREMWCGPENVSKEIFLPGTKFHLNISSGSEVITKFCLGGRVNTTKKATEY